MKRAANRILTMLGVGVLFFIVSISSEIYRDFIKPVLSAAVYTPTVQPSPTRGIQPFRTVVPTSEIPCTFWKDVKEKKSAACVFGEVARIVEYTGAWQIRFSDDRHFFLAGGTFYYPNIKTGDCVYAKGDVLLSSENVPYINIDKDNLFYCETWMKPK